MKKYSEISVIVCFKNAEKTIKSTLESILNQTFKDFELILIDDNSEDSSLECCKELQKKNNNIRIFSFSNNLKPLKARQEGVRNSNSKYIFFCDADDILPSNSLEVLHDIATETDVDVVCGGFQYVIGRKLNFVYDFKNVLNFDGKLINDLIVNFNENEKTKYSFFGGHSIPISFWGKLFRRDKLIDFEKADLPCLHNFDDTYGNLIIFNSIKSIYFTPKLVYKYYHGGFTSKVNHDILKDFDKVYLLRKNNNLNEQSKNLSNLEYFNVFISYIENCMIVENTKKQDIHHIVNKHLKDGYLNEVVEYFLNVNTNNDLIKSLSCNDIDVFEKEIRKSVESKKLKRKLTRLSLSFINKFL